MGSETLRAVLADLAARHQVPGAQLVVRTDSRIAVIETGEEIHGSGRPLAPEAAIPIGSLTKPFTATLAMMLVADGEVGLDAPLSAYLPEPVPRITLRQVLAHTSGLASDLAEHTVQTTERSRWVARHCGVDALVHRPGTVFSYSNVGYLLAGYLVEVVTGMTWREAVGSILLRPLGIEPSFVTGAAIGRTAVAGHSVAGNGNVAPVFDQRLPRIEAPTGALALSAADLATFARLHLADPGLPGLLDPATAEAMRQDQTGGTEVGPFGFADGWGLGWAVYQRGGRTWYGHEGTGMGTSCHLRVDPVSGVVVAFAANASTGLAMWQDVVDELRACGVHVGSYPWSSLAEPIGEVFAPAACLGRFVNGDNEFTIAGSDGGRLRMLIDGTPYGELACTEDLRFTMRTSPDGMVCIGRFLPGPGTGAVNRIQVLGRVARRCG